MDVVPIRMAKVFITVIVNKTDITEQKVKQCTLISSLGVPMYAIIREGINWDDIKHIPWKKVYYAKSPQEVPQFVSMIDFEMIAGSANA